MYFSKLANIWCTLLWSQGKKTKKLLHLKIVIPLSFIGYKFDLTISINCCVLRYRQGRALNSHIALSCQVYSEIQFSQILNFLNLLITLLDLLHLVKQSVILPPLSQTRDFSTTSTLDYLYIQTSSDSWADWIGKGVFIIMFLQYLTLTSLSSPSVMVTT